MIRKLDLLNVDEVNALLNMQRLAYSVEADLIGYYDIPPLKDTIQSLQSSNETFYGYIQEGEMYGAISFTKQAGEIDICRLVVHPEKFRQGIGRSLLEHLMATEQSVSRFIVATGQQNTPAIKLYRQYGFFEIGTTEISPGIFIVHMVRNA